MAQFLHDLGFGQEVLGIHCTWKKEKQTIEVRSTSGSTSILTGLQSLDRHWCGVVPQSLPDIAKLARAQLAHEFEGSSVDLPLVASPMREALGDRLLDL